MFNILNKNIQYVNFIKHDSVKIKLNSIDTINTCHMQRPILKKYTSQSIKQRRNILS